MNNLAVNTVERDLYPLESVNPQSIYDYFADKKLSNANSRTDGAYFVSQDGEIRRPYRIFNRSFEENPQYPYFRIMEHSNSILTAWHSQNDKEPSEFELLNLKDMSHDNVAWLRAAGQPGSLAVNKTEKLLAMVYHDGGWRIDIRRSDNFQLREVVHHTAPVVGMFFYNDVMFSLSNKLIVSYPEERHANCLISSSEKVLGWAQHPVEPYVVLIEPDRYKIIDLNTLKLVKKAEWTEEMKWFYLLQRYSNHNMNLHFDKSAVGFSTDGNRLFLGGHGQLAVFDWHDMLRPRCVDPAPVNMINMQSTTCGEQEKSSDVHIIDMVPINRDKLLCATADGYLHMVNTRTDERFLLLTPTAGVRMNSLQLCADAKYLAMVGYCYGFDNKGCNVESALMIWKLSRLLNKSSAI